MAEQVTYLMSVSIEVNWIRDSDVGKASEKTTLKFGLLDDVIIKRDISDLMPVPVYFG